MKYYNTSAHIAADGSMFIKAPMDFAGMDVRVTLAGDERPVSGAARFKTQQEWVDFIDRVKGSIDDASFKRPPQLRFDDRKLFE